MKVCDLTWYSTSNKDIPENIEVVFVKLGTRNVDHKRNKMTPVMLFAMTTALLLVLF